jgi:hypothetical protein
VLFSAPDDSGAEGFLLSGGNIIFASAPAGGVDFFGVILAGADYINIGANFPSGTALVPSITFDSDLDTGIYNPAGNQIGFTTAGVQRLVINSSGQVSGGLGSATTPAFSFLSDPNTGIYSPGADQVAVATNGVGRLFVDANGNVGVGASPTTNNAITFPNNGSLAFAGPIGQLNTNSSFSSGSERYITSAEAARYYQISGEHIWQTAAAGTAGNTISFSERLRITSAGLVGIGTSSPIGLLQLKYATNVNTSFRNSSAAGLTAGTLVEAVNDGFSAFTPYYIRASEYGFGTDSGGTYVPRFTIDSSGNVGIGTTTVSAKLHIAGATGGGVAGIWDTAAGGARIEYKDNGTRRGLLNWDTNSLLLAADYGNSIKFSTNAGVTQHATIDSSGRLGIGTSDVKGALGLQHGNTSPQGLTDVAIDALRINQGVGGSIAIRATQYDSINQPAAGDTQFFNFFYNGSTYNWYERMRITAEGRVGIGTTTVNNGVLHVKSNGTGSQSGLAVEASANDSFFSITNNGSAHILGATYNSTGSYQPISFDINGEKARIDTSGRLLVGTSSSFDANCTLQAVGGNAAQFFRWGADGCNVYIGCARGTQGSPSTLNNGDIIGSLNFRGHDGSAYRDGASITAVVDATTGASDFPSRLVFSTTADGASSPTERMRISQNGQVSVSNALEPLLLLSTSTAGVSNYLLAGNNNVATVAYIWSNGNLQNTNGSYTAISDAKLKENIVDAGSQWNDFKAIKIRNWNFKAETGHETHRQIGPIAQELETVCPGLVFETLDRDEDGNETGEVTKGVNQSVLYMKAVKALQEAMERIEQLETEMAEVKAQLS